MDETGGQISNVGQQVDGSSDAEESQRLVSSIPSIVLLITLITHTLIIYSYEYYVPPSFFVIIIDNKLNILVSSVQKFKTYENILYRKKMMITNQKSEKRRKERNEKHVVRIKRERKRRKRKNPILGM